MQPLKNEELRSICDELQAAETDGERLDCLKRYIGILNAGGIKVTARIWPDDTQQIVFELPRIGEEPAANSDLFEAAKRLREGFGMSDVAKEMTLKAIPRDRIVILDGAIRPIRERH